MAPPRLLDQVREAARLRHLSPRTEKAYVFWVRRFVLFHGKRNPRELGAAEVRAFLSHLAVERNVAASTQNQAAAALLFLYRKVLKLPLGELGEIEHARKPSVSSYISGLGARSMSLMETILPTSSLLPARP